MKNLSSPWPGAKWRFSGTQGGAVLFFTLIALVAMTLAALAMMRSVETGNLVAGNIALKQGATQEADRILSTAFRCLDKGGALLPPLAPFDVRDSDHMSTLPCYQYSSVLLPDTKKPFGYPDILKGDPSSLPSQIVKSLDAATGNTSVYIIERMCTVTGMWTEENCIDALGTPAPDGDISNPGSLPTSQALYRVSVRVFGPRNTNAFSQLIISSQL